MDSKLVGKKIAELRKQKGWSQYEFAEKIHMSPSTVAMWELGEREIKSSTLSEIADLFDVNTDYLLGRAQHLPTWATSKDKRDFKKMLEEDAEVMFDGVPMSPEDKQRVMDVLTGLFWEAKRMNKRKEK